MITVKEAYDAIDPAIQGDERRVLAERILMSAAAFDAYLDSRSQLEQIIANATGAGKVPAHADINTGKGGPVASGAGTEAATIGTPAVPATGATTDATSIDDKAADEAELEAARQRVAQLEAETKGA